MDLVQGKKKKQPQQQTKPNQNIASCEWLSETHKPFSLTVEFKIMPGLVEPIKKNIYELYFTIKKERESQSMCLCI